MTIRKRTLDLGVGYVDQHFGKRYIFPIKPGASLPRQAPLQKFDARLETVNAVRQTVPCIAPATNPSPECSSVVIVVKSEPFRWPQTTVAQPVSRTGWTLALWRRSHVTEFFRILDASAMFLAGSFPRPLKFSLGRANIRFISFLVRNSLWGLLKSSSSSAAIARRLFGSFSRSSVEFPHVRCAQSGSMLVCERFALPSFAHLFTGAGQ